MMRGKSAPIAFTGSRSQPGDLQFNLLPELWGEVLVGSKTQPLASTAPTRLTISYIKPNFIGT
jgi:hypothetical protein